MGGKHHYIGALSPVNNPQNAATKRRDSFVGASAPWMPWVLLGPVRLYYRFLNPAPVDPTLLHLVFGMRPVTDHAARISHSELAGRR
jgi:hypothetical protein